MSWLSDSRAPYSVHSAARVSTSSGRAATARCASSIARPASLPWLRRPSAFGERDRVVGRIGREHDRALALEDRVVDVEVQDQLAAQPAMRMVDVRRRRDRLAVCRDRVFDPAGRARGVGALERRARRRTRRSDVGRELALEVGIARARQLRRCLCARDPCDHDQHDADDAIAHHCEMPPERYTPPPVSESPSSLASNATTVRM